MSDSIDCDVLCAGLIVADVVCAPIQRLPAGGSLAMTSAIDLAVGGCAANVAVDLARLGLRARVAGRVGDDVFGQYVSQILRGEGVLTDGIVVSETSGTAATMIVNVVGDDRRFIHTAGANAEFTGEDIKDEVIAGSRAVYVGGYGLNAALGSAQVERLFQVARNHGRLTVLDVVVGDNDVRRLLEPVLPSTDVFLPNTDEAKVVTGLNRPGDQAKFFRDLGAATVIVTCGAEGAVLVDEQESFHMPAHIVDQLDPTGGGDAFAAGYIYGRLNGRFATECVSLGAALGASCVRAAGATTGVFDEPKLLDFVASHPLTPLRSGME